MNSGSQIQVGKKHNHIYFSITENFFFKLLFGPNGGKIFE